MSADEPKDQIHPPFQPDVTLVSYSLFDIKLREAEALEGIWRALDAIAEDLISKTRRQAEQQETIDKYLRKKWEG